MRQIFLSLVALIMASGTAFADNDKPIAVKQLPAAAKQFISSYFSDAKVSYAKVEQEFFAKSYEVVFTNGSKVEFNNKGEWKDVDCKHTQIPEGIVPQQIKNHVTANYKKDVKIVAIDRDRYDYEIKMSNGLELKFDLNFNLIEIDD
ncbi:MAG: PepSY-like domain-containing protein [Paludibacteraceae bacterium]